MSLYFEEFIHKKPEEAKKIIEEIKSSIPEGETVNSDEVLKALQYNETESPLGEEPEMDDCFCIFSKEGNFYVSSIPQEKSNYAFVYLDRLVFSVEDLEEILKKLDITRVNVLVSENGYFRSIFSGFIKTKNLIEKYSEIEESDKLYFVVFITVIIIFVGVIISQT